MSPAVPAARITTSSPTRSRRRSAARPPRTVPASPRNVPSSSARSAVPKPERGRGRAVGEPGQEASLLLGAAALLDDRRCQHGREERARRHLAAELVEHDHQLRQSGPGPSVLLGQVDPEPTQISHLAPIGRPGLLVGLEQGAGGLERLVGGEDAADRGGQLLVVVGDGDRHRKVAPLD